MGGFGCDVRVSVAVSVSLSLLCCGWVGCCLLCVNVCDSVKHNLGLLGTAWMAWTSEFSLDGRVRLRETAGCTVCLRERL